MKAKEIRSFDAGRFSGEMSIFLMLREIAAQLAELKEHFVPEDLVAKEQKKW